LYGTVLYCTGIIIYTVLLYDQIVNEAKQSKTT
jgi:hypothetical protein